MAFRNERISEKARYGYTGGPSFSTDVITVKSGVEQRNSNWAVARGQWDIEYVEDEAGLKELVAFFRACGGKRDTFRFKDWLDYKVIPAESVFLKLDTLQPLVDTPYCQLAKKYTLADGQGEVRPITKPVLSSFKFYSYGTEFSGWALDETTGILKLPNKTPILNVASVVSNGSTTDISTVGSHGYSNGQVVGFDNFGGTRGQLLNNKSFSITVITTTKFTINVDSTGTTGTHGTVSTYYTASDAITFSCEFDVPVRFDTDEFNASITDKGAYFINSLPIVEDKS